MISRLATRVTQLLGTTAAIVASAVLVVAWALSGPLFGFSNAWQLVINTGTTVITFLMVFVIHHSQTLESRALHTKLDAMIKAIDGVDDKLVGLEESPEEEILNAQLGLRED